MPEVKSNLNGKILSAVIDFDFIVNTDLGLIRLIREKYQDDRAFKLDILNKSDREILSLLYSCTNPNPLYIISTEKNIQDIDKLYSSFIKDYKKEILLRSTAEYNTVIFIQMALKSEANLGVNLSFYCKDSDEINELESHFGKLKILTQNDRSSIPSRDSYYVKDYKFFTNLHLENKIIHKVIYTSPREYNIKYFESVSNQLTSTNVFILMGKDYREKKSNGNEKSDDK